MPIAPEDRARLLELARASVKHTVAGGPAVPLGPCQGVLAEQRGCFVTLTNQEALRGCIGTFTPRRPLGESVVEMAASAAKDPRFIYYRPITPDELSDLTVAISVLSPLEPIDDPLSLEIGTHGIYIVSGRGGGCFLPEVATDQDWNAEQFLTQCCTGKAGLAPDAWRDSETQVYVFTSEKFSE